MSAPTTAKHFDDAWDAALKIAQALRESGADITLIRDVLGRATILVGPTSGGEVTTTAAAEQMRTDCWPFVGAPPIMAASDLFDPDALTAAQDLVVLQKRDAKNGFGRLALLERGVIGREWREVEPTPRPNRVTLYGFKGGVGRSTATVILARHLAEQGKCVLVVDLDLESPGLSAVALEPDDAPAYGIVDLLVESVFGLADNDLECVSLSNRLRVEGNGEVWVAPAGGRPRDGYTYIPKLNRSYIDTWDNAPPSALTTADRGRESSFGSRLAMAVDYCTKAVERRSRVPDVVLLDSRAGIHDIAAIAITKLSDLVLLFGVDNSQTWNGYSEMFRQWQVDPRLSRTIRDRLRMVATMVPAAGHVEYLNHFRDNAQTLFSETLYDNVPPGEADAFNPPLEDPDAPHSPLPILFTTDLVGFDMSTSAAWLEKDFVNAAFGRFVRGASDLIIGSVGDTA